MYLPPTAGATVRQVRKSAADIWTRSEVVLVLNFFFSPQRCSPINPFESTLSENGCENLLLDSLQTRDDYLLVMITDRLSIEKKIKKM